MSNFLEEARAVYRGQPKGAKLTATVRGFDSVGNPVSLTIEHQLPANMGVDERTFMGAADSAFHFAFGTDATHGDDVTGPEDFIDLEVQGEADPDAVELAEATIREIGERAQEQAPKDALQSLLDNMVTGPEGPTLN